MQIDPLYHLYLYVDHSVSSQNITVNPPPFPFSTHTIRNEMHKTSLRVVWGGFETCTTETGFSNKNVW